PGTARAPPRGRRGSGPQHQRRAAEAGGKVERRATCCRGARHMRSLAPVAELSLIDWTAPGPYRVAFSTRVGGVSDGPYSSLNLGMLTEDDPARVVANRTRLCEAVGADPDGATMGWRRHGATVTRPQPPGIVTPATVYD